RSERRHRADSHRTGDEAHRRTRPAVESRRTGARPTMKRVLMAIVVASVWPASGYAQMASAAAGYKREPGMAASAGPAALREIEFDQHIGGRLPLDTIVRAEDGRATPFATYFSSRPVVLVFAYYSCPMLCTQVFNGLASAVGVLSLEPGRDFDVVAISF